MNNWLCSGSLKYFNRYRLHKMVFYGVKVGRNPGIYKTWKEAEQQVLQFPSPKFRKFESETEAFEFVYGPPKPLNSGKSTILIPALPQIEVPDDEVIIVNDLSKNEKFCTCTCTCGAFPNVPLTSIFAKNLLKRDCNAICELEPPTKIQKNVFPPNSSIITDKSKQVDIYTDGACSKNGKINSHGGIGVYWGENHPMNLSEPLQGRQTNNRAEIMAAVTALNQAKSLGLNNIVIHTDSQFLINGITKWIYKWKKNGWKLSTGGEVINKDDFEALDEAQKGLTVRYMYVQGHRGDAGNEAADRLAVMARDRNA